LYLWLTTFSPVSGGGGGGGGVCRGDKKAALRGQKLQSLGKYSLLSFSFSSLLGCYDPALDPPSLYCSDKRQDPDLCLGEAESVGLLACNKGLSNIRILPLACPSQRLGHGSKYQLKNVAILLYFLL
jgi:hypothetical protein